MDSINQDTQEGQVESKSLLARFLTPDLREELSGLKTKSGFVLDDVIRSGIENPDSSIGVYAPDAYSYEVFKPLFSAVIEEYHGHGESDVHTKNFNPSLLDIPDPDPESKFIVSTRVRVGRNLAGFPFSPGVSNEQRKEVESRVVDALSYLTGDLAGTYYPLAGMSEEVRQKLVEDHLLFKQGDRFLESAGVNRDWPFGRGIFHSADKSFLVWVNEEDHMRIISMEQGGDLYSVFERLARAVAALEEKLDFAYTDRLGYLSSCPTNLGTAMRASVHIKLPHLSMRSDFEDICSGLGLSVRGIHGEHSESEGGVYDISNKRRLGITEVDGINVLYSGIQKLIELES